MVGKAARTAFPKTNGDRDDAGVLGIGGETGNWYALSLRSRCRMKDGSAGRGDMADRKGITRAFLWQAVLTGGPLLGAKLFDLVVLAGAWSTRPPASLAMMPYGKVWPVDTGVFFIPLSVAMLLGGFGALVTGWRTRWRYR